MTTSLPWWRTDSYDVDEGLPQAVVDYAGPKDIALVKAWPDGRTDKGWGLLGPNGEDGFIPRYNRGEFNSRRVLFGYNKGRWNFALVMRSVRLVCIDIDGKNGGLEHAKRLGMLPHTLAETSKSGDGYHLFYVVDEEWDEARGFGLLADRIGIEQGVDIRATGCVYHHPQQRWNDRAPVPLPAHLKKLLLHREQKITAETERITKVLDSQDEMEILMMQDDLLTELAKPIPQGKRNVTLFAIGNKMRQAQLPDWSEKLRDRAHTAGLPVDETDKLINNIDRYGSPIAP
jgi:hypothetical protein